MSSVYQKANNHTTTRCGIEYMDGQQVGTHNQLQCCSSLCIGMENRDHALAQGYSALELTILYHSIGPTRYSNQV